MTNNLKDHEAAFVFTRDMEAIAILCRYNGVEEAEELLALPEEAEAWALLPIPRDLLPRGAYAIDDFLAALEAHRGETAAAL